MQAFGRTTNQLHINVKELLVSKSFLANLTLENGLGITFVLNSTFTVQCLSNQGNFHSLAMRVSPISSRGQWVHLSVLYAQGICNKLGMTVSSDVPQSELTSGREAFQWILSMGHTHLEFLSEIIQNTLPQILLNIEDHLQLNSIKQIGKFSKIHQCQKVLTFLSFPISSVIRVR